MYIELERPGPETAQPSARTHVCEAAAAAACVYLVWPTLRTVAESGFSLLSDLATTAVSTEAGNWLPPIASLPIASFPMAAALAATAIGTTAIASRYLADRSASTPTRHKSSRPSARTRVKLADRIIREKLAEVDNTVESALPYGTSNREADHARWGRSALRLKLQTVRQRNHEDSVVHTTCGKLLSHGHDYNGIGKGMPLACAARAVEEGIGNCSERADYAFSSLTHWASEKPVPGRLTVKRVEMARADHAFTILEWETPEHQGSSPGTTRRYVSDTWLNLHGPLTPQAGAEINARFSNRAPELECYVDHSYCNDSELGYSIPLTDTDVRAATPSDDTLAWCDCESDLPVTYYEALRGGPPRSESDNDV